MLVCAVVTVAVTGGGVAAFAGWTTSTASGPFTVQAARLPQPARPDVTVRGVPRIAWQPVAVAPRMDLHRYVVTRHLGPAAQVACTVPATETGCVDVHAPPGRPVTYTLTVTYGSRWVGLASGRSRAVTRPGVAVPIVVEGGTVHAGPSARPVVTESAEDGGVDGDGEPILGPPASAEPDPPPVVVPPAPPGGGDRDVENVPTAGPDSENGPPERPADACPDDTADNRAWACGAP